MPVRNCENFPRKAEHDLVMRVTSEKVIGVYYFSIYPHGARNDV
jgi:hypothetical protein